MKTLFPARTFHPFHRVAATLALGAACASLPVAGGTITGSATPAIAVPDGNDSGVVSIIDIPATPKTIRDVNLTLSLVAEPGGAWNGDLYIYIAHAGVLSVLANRPGVSTANPFGYGDNGLAQVTFDDDAVLGDFHVYQATLNSGDTTLPIGGIFQPDARTTDPSLVLPEHDRRAFLSGFNGLNPSGEWRLFVADLSLGASVRLASWALEIDTGDVLSVPEPRTGLVAAGLTTFLLALAPRLLRQRAPR